jgi:hypothetical protein
MGSLPGRIEVGTVGSSASDTSRCAPKGHFSRDNWAGIEMTLDSGFGNMGFGIDNVISWQSGLCFPRGLLVYREAHEHKPL